MNLKPSRVLSKWDGMPIISSMPVWISSIFESLVIFLCVSCAYKFLSLSIFFHPIVSADDDDVVSSACEWVN